MSTYASKFNLQGCFTTSKLLLVLALILVDYCQAGRANSFATRKLVVRSPCCKLKASTCTCTSKFNLQGCFTKSKLLLVLVLIFLDYCQTGWANIYTYFFVQPPEKHMPFDQPAGISERWRSGW